ncbi:MAG: 4Fe-4S binding protein [Nitrospinaceae bacterium]|jgi:polyferredoxin|nr:4Fe-4S binding protein [Nitrospinaceae bacterium]MBT3822068.1 4Fe-4S binding protein [Nitrospinaceae bacterium]MBT4095043.1 4Fe-4S binding protein [Nitrospinaceae bacterium]MBT4431695.1 4Fe-4S binding protein [Nitrospinaceae bacterium]MBT5368182.1 4Fe-4S binding protein [Nitrospinaceae bacterium]
MNREDKVVEKLKKIGVVIFQAISLVAVVLFISVVSNRMWGGKPEKIELPAELTLRMEMPLSEVAAVNGLSRKVVQKAFSLGSDEVHGKTLGDLGINIANAEVSLRKAQALSEQHGSKNWIKIFSKFALWLVFLLVVFYLVLRKKVTPKLRKGMLASSLLIFGVLLGSEPNPMGTIKDTITLLGISGVIFPPRAIALSVFLLSVILANKFICSWGCHLGVFQDLLHRLNRGKRDRRGIIPQIKPPFWLSNGIRIATFAAMTGGAFLWAFDLLEPIDPFRVFKPTHLSIIGGAAVLLVLAASLVVYRPWCSFFCPFGLVGWLGEKISVFKIKIDYGNCPKCNACVKVCPSNAMDAILYRDKVIPDCYTCGACMDICPTDAITFGVGQRDRPTNEWLEMPMGKVRFKEEIKEAVSTLNGVSPMNSAKKIEKIVA